MFSNANEGTIEEMEVRVKSPASSANIGPCFDCAGIALPIYNILTVEKTKDNRIEVIISEKEDIRTFNVDEKNIIYQSFKKFHERIGYNNTGYRVKVETEIPIARGLGSSASVIVGSLKAANILNGNKLEEQELIDIAAEIEGHPDNTTPAFVGGFVVSSIEEGGHVLYKKIEWNKDWKIVVCIPDYKLLTELSRAVLPKEIEFRDAVYNIQKSSQLITAIATKDRKMMKVALKDRIHQPYREKLIPGMPEIIERLRKEEEVLGCVLSGAGPTLAVITEGEDIKKIEEIVHKVWYDLDIKYKIKPLTVEETGVADI